MTVRPGADNLPKAPRVRPLPVDDVDEVAVHRACAGDLSVPLNRHEMAAAVHELRRRGHSGYTIADILGVTDRSVWRWLAGYHYPAARHLTGPLARRRGLERNQDVAA